MIDPIDDDLAALLQDAKPIAAPEEAKARVLTRLAAALPPPPTGGGGSGGNTAPSPPAAPLAAGFPAWALAAALAVGAGLGLGGSLLLPPRERVVYIDRPVPAAPVTVAQVAAQPVPSPSGLRLEDLPRAPTVTPSASAASAAHGEDLAKERAVLDVARSALGRGDAANTLVATGEHERKFPQGALVEEREALAIQALAMQGQRTGAQARADRFRKRFPRSMLLPAVDAVVGSGPDSRERDL